MANVCKILLYRNEEPLACLLVSYFEVAFDRDMYRMSIDNKFFQFLKYTFVFKKNYVGKKDTPGARRNTKAQKLTLVELIAIIKEREQLADVQ
jgi:hypothetical protein